MGKRCTPFCPPSCPVVHDRLLVKLLNVQEGNPVSLDEFEAAAEKKFKLGFQPEDPIPDRNPEYRYPLLHWAVVLGKFSVVQFLLNNGHSPLLKSPEKSETPLHRAIHCLVLGLKELKDNNRLRRFQQIVSLLGPSVAAQDDNDDTPLHLCAKYITEYHLQGYLRYYMEAMDSMIDYVVKNDKAYVFDLQNSDGNTLLHIFAQAHSEMCFVYAKRLVKLGAAISIKNNSDKLVTDVARVCSYRLFLYIDKRKHTLKKRTSRRPSSTSETSLLQMAEPSTVKKPRLIDDKDCIEAGESSSKKVQLVPSLTREGLKQESNDNEEETQAGHNGPAGPSGNVVDNVGFPHTPPYMPGDLEHNNVDTTDLKYELVGDLFNELSNCNSGNLNSERLQDKGGFLKDLLKRSGQIAAWVNETKNILEEKNKELEEQRATYHSLAKETDQMIMKQQRLQNVIDLKRREIQELEKEITETKSKENELDKEKTEQQDAILKTEQLIATLGQIVVILEND